MTHADGTTGPEIWERIDDLAFRVEHLEGLLLSEADATELEAAAVPPPAVRSIGPATEPVASGRVTAATRVADIEPDTPGDTGATPDPEHRDPRTPQAKASPGFAASGTMPLPQSRRPAIDLRFIEEQVAGRALALVGGAALLLGAILFLSLAFSRGWISPGLQVTLGLAGGSVGLIVGGILLVRGDRLVGHVLTAVGLAVISLSLFAATSLYDLIDATLALTGTFIAVGATTAIAIRTRSQIVAGFGLVAALAAPPILGAEPEMTTLVYMVAVLAGIAVVSVRQTWSWLPPIAFVLSLPQLYLWIDGRPEPLLGVGALLLYWAIMTLAAGGEAFRRRGHELSITSAPLFLAVGASVIGLAWVLLESDQQRAGFMLSLALAHGLITAFFLHRKGTLDPFGLLAGAYGIAIASAAVPLLLGATFTAVIWSIEAATLAFFAGRRAHGPSLIAATVLYAIAAVQLTYEALRLSPAREWMGFETAAGTPETLLVGFIFFAVVGAAIVALVPVRSFRYLVVGAVGIVALPAAHLAFDGVVVVAGWVAIALAAAGSPRWLPLLPERPVEWRLGPALEWLRPRADTAPATSLLAMATAAAATILATILTIDTIIRQDQLPTVPFAGEVGISALLLAAGYVGIGVLLGGSDNLRRGLLAAGLAIGVVSLTQFTTPWYVIVWAGLAVAAAWLARIDDSGLLKYRYASLVSLAVLAVLAVIEGPPHRLVVTDGGVAPHPFMVSDTTLALGVLAVALALAAMALPIRPGRISTGLGSAAGLVVLYLLSIGVVDVFAAEAYGLGYRSFDRLEELAKEAQVALSVLWTVVGVVTLGIGLVLRRASLRFAGLVVLTLATAKVFVIDLASLDVAYRVITLIVLGLLLVASAYAWTRMRPSAATDRDAGPPSPQPKPDDVHAHP